MMRFTLTLTVLVASLASGCSQNSDQAAAPSRDEASSQVVTGSAAPRETESQAPGAASPQAVASEDIAKSAMLPPENAHMTSSPEMERSARGSQNDDNSIASASLHPAEVSAASLSKANALRGARSSLRDDAVANALGAARVKENGTEGSAAASPTEEAADEKLPAISLHECELFHNHRDGHANEVAILYGTDRDRVDHTPVFDKIWAGFCSSLTGSVGVTLGFAMCAFFAARKKVLILATLGSSVFTAFLGFPLVADLSVTTMLCSERKPGYGVGRGELQLGVCRISIPPIHVPGEVETASIFSFDVIPDAERHFFLNEVEPLSDEPFYAELRRQVARSSKKDVFVFIHGYNVSFESAALRTAQMKADLEFEGAACFYSWPSQGGLLQYTRDEENVRYTISHLRAFLTSVAQQSAAESIHLIAHSMGNRALTDVLKEMRLELGKDGSRMFNQVILAAPDVDAQIFMRDLAPRIRDTAERVTLYASSNDRALLASKIVHGYQRAGDSGRNLVVVDGVETVDVSSVDCSLLGHSYYGDSASVLTDLALVLRGKRAKLDRTWLTQEEMAGLPFWRFSTKDFKLAQNAAKTIR